jgi:hypothetical protein
MIENESASRFQGIGAAFRSLFELPKVQQDKNEPLDLSGRRCSENFRMLIKNARQSLDNIRSAESHGNMAVGTWIFLSSGSIS